MPCALEPYQNGRGATGFAPKPMLTTQRDENGKPYVLDSVRKAEDKLHAQLSDKEYLPITVRAPDATLW